MTSPGILTLAVSVSLIAGVASAGLVRRSSAARRLTIRLGRTTWSWVALIVTGLLGACMMLYVALTASQPSVSASIAAFLGGFTVQFGYVLKRRCEFWQEVKWYEFRKKRNVDLTSWKKVGPVFGTKSHFGHADWRFVTDIDDLNFLVQQILNHFEHKELSGTEAVSEVLAYYRYSNLRDYSRLVSVTKVARTALPDTDSFWQFYTDWCVDPKDEGSLKNLTDNFPQYEERRRRWLELEKMNPGLRMHLQTCDFKSALQDLNNHTGLFVHAVDLCLHEEPEKQELARRWFDDFNENARIKNIETCLPERESREQAFDLMKQKKFGEVLELVHQRPDVFRDIYLCLWKPGEPEHASAYEWITLEVERRRKKELQVEKLRRLVQRHKELTERITDYYRKDSDRALTALHSYENVMAKLGDALGAPPQDDAFWLEYVLYDICPDVTKSVSERAAEGKNTWREISDTIANDLREWEAWKQQQRMAVLPTRRSEEASSPFDTGHMCPRCGHRLRYMPVGGIMSGRSIAEAYAPRYYYCPQCGWRSDY